MIVTPEHNYSIPGVLKNAVDWASRPPEQPFDGKPIGLYGCERRYLGCCEGAVSSAAVLRVPERPGNEPARGDDPASQNKFDADGKLNDQATREFIAAHLGAFKAWVLRLK